MDPDIAKLAELLERRLAVIGDHQLREEDPEEQLRQLKEVSEELSGWHKKMAPRLKPRLAHFMENRSYEKALDWIRQNPEG